MFLVKATAGVLLFLAFAMFATAGDAATFAWAANKECNCSAFAWAATKHGCDCGHGCPCCASGKPCECTKGSCRKDAVYNELREKAIKENRTLLVFVGCDPPAGLKDLTCRVESMPGLKAPTVAVCKNVNGVFSRVAELPVSATYQQFMSPPATCPDGKCPLGFAHPLAEALAALAVGAMDDCPGGVCPPRKPLVAFFEAPKAAAVAVATRPVVTYSVSEPAVVVRVRRTPLRRLFSLPFRAVRAYRGFN